MSTIGERWELLTAPPRHARGWTEVIKPVDPAAGSSYTRKVPGETWDRLLAVTFTFTASAVVANRTVQMRLLDETGAIIASVSASGTVVASTVVRPRLIVGLGYADNNASGHTDQGMWDMVAQSGWQFNINVQGMDVGDQISSIVLTMQRFSSEFVRYIDNAPETS